MMPKPPGPPPVHNVTEQGASWAKGRCGPVLAPSPVAWTPPHRCDAPDSGVLNALWGCSCGRIWQRTYIPHGAATLTPWPRGMTDFGWEAARWRARREYRRRTASGER